MHLSRIKRVQIHHGRLYFNFQSALASVISERNGNDTDKLIKVTFFSKVHNPFKPTTCDLLYISLFTFAYYQLHFDLCWHAMWGTNSSFMMAQKRRIYVIEFRSGFFVISPFKRIYNILRVTYIFKVIKM